MQHRKLQTMNTQQKNDLRHERLINEKDKIKKKSKNDKAEFQQTDFSRPHSVVTYIC